MTTPDLRSAISAALDELGVPDENYPAPVANAVGILRAALAQPEPLDVRTAPKCDLVCGHSGDHWVAEEDDDA